MYPAGATSQGYVQPQQQNAATQPMQPTPVPPHPKENSVRQPTTAGKFITLYIDVHVAFIAVFLR